MVNLLVVGLLRASTRPFRQQPAGQRDGFSDFGTFPAKNGRLRSLQRIADDAAVFRGRHLDRV